jgi:hypothetical protein
MKGEFRLREISEAPEGKILATDGKNIYCSVIQHFTNGTHKWAYSACDCLYPWNPTHFLQFKINGEWTHEFKMGEE